MVCSAMISPVVRSMVMVSLPAMRMRTGWCVGGAPVEDSVGAFMVVDAGERVELVLQAGDGWG